MGFISIGGPLLGQTVTGTVGHTLPADFVKLASQLGGPKADVRSHLKAAFDAIGVTWTDENLSFTVRHAVAGELLENLVRDRPVDHVAVLLRTFQRFGREALNDPRFADYLRDWIRGQFMEFGPPAPAPRQGADQSQSGPRKKQRRRR